MYKFEVLQKFPECSRETKWANAVAKMVLIDLLDWGLSQTFNLLKMQYLQSAIKQRTVKWDVPVYDLIALYVGILACTFWFHFFSLWGNEVRLDSFIILGLPLHNLYIPSSNIIFLRVFLAPSEYVGCTYKGTRYFISRGMLVHYMQSYPGDRVP